MPMRKYRSIDDVPDAALRPRHDPANLRIACELSLTAMRLAPRCVPPGVRRFRSIAEASAAREAWEKSATIRR
jgi:hypothetical protein